VDAVDAVEWLDRLAPAAVTESAGRPSGTLAELGVRVESLSWDWLREWLGVPNVQWATFKPGSKGWHYVKFGSPFREPPAVAAVCSGFSFQVPGWRPLPQLSMPAVSQLPDLRLPRIQRPDYAPLYEERFRDAFISFVGDWGVFNWMRDAIAWAIGKVGWVCGALANWEFDATYKPFLDQVNAALEAFEDAWNTRIVNAFNTNVKATLESFAAAWNSEVVGRLNDALSTVQERLLNLTSGLGVTPLAVRDVTTTGCYVYAPAGTTVYVIAAGR